MDKAVVLVSGGMDGATVLYKVKKQVSEVFAVSFDYGQRHKIELGSARLLARKAEVKEHKILSIDLSQIGGSPLTDSKLSVPTQQDQKQRSTVVPFRNSMFLTMAAAFGEVNGVHDIFYGACYEDLLNYPDCRPEFIKALSKSLSLGATQDNSKVSIHAPFAMISKKEIVKEGLALRVPYEFTYSCYQGQIIPCIVSNNQSKVIDKLDPTKGCDACMERYVSFRDNGIVDPLLIRLKEEGVI